jgi:transposase
MAARHLRAQRYYGERKEVVAIAWRRGLSEAQISSRYDFSRDFVRYWIRKTQDATWHAGSVGGQRNFAFSATEEQAVEAALWRALEANPTGMLDEFAASILRDTNLQANARWIDRCLLRWGFSRKIALYKQVLKYTLRNIRYYASFVATIPGIDPLRLKFGDESHFASRRCVPLYFRLPSCSTRWQAA